MNQHLSNFMFLHLLAHKTGSVIVVSPTEEDAKDKQLQAELGKKKLFPIAPKDYVPQPKQANQIVGKNLLRKLGG